MSFSYFFFFFFKQKTAYEMRISDWSSDVCSSDLWQSAVAEHPFLAGLTSEEDEALRRRAAWVLASKTFSGAQGLEVTDRIMLSIAIQAALPILNLDPVLYEGWTEIIVYPGGFLIPRNDVDESGVVHRSEERRVGKECVSTCRSGWSRYI